MNSVVLFLLVLGFGTGNAAAFGVGFCGGSDDVLLLSSSSSSSSLSSSSRHVVLRIGRRRRRDATQFAIWPTRKDGRMAGYGVPRLTCRLPGTTALRQQRDDNGSDNDTTISNAPPPPDDDNNLNNYKAARTNDDKINPTPLTSKFDSLLSENDDVDKNNNNKNNNNNNNQSQKNAPPVSYSEDDVGRKLMFRLTWLSRLDRAIYAVGLVFLLSAFVLNLFGYSYLIDDHGTLRIDTLEARQFRDEIVQSNRRQQQQQQQQRRQQEQSPTLQEPQPMMMRQEGQEQPQPYLDSNEDQ
ncbi:hypothetical protein ACA910_018750 [Epithemia clementina (nom. ined.)]